MKNKGRIFHCLGLAFLLGLSDTRAEDRPAGNVESATIRFVADIRYSENDPDDLDLYLPLEKTNFPVVISVHGGSLIHGSKEEETFVGNSFAASGIGAVVLNYRLYPQSAHPDNIQDLVSAVSWVREHIKEYGGDPDRIFIIGHSAGAYLAGLLLTDKSFLAGVKLDPDEFSGAALVSAFYDVVEVAPMRKEPVWGADPEFWRKASPKSHVRAGLLPLLMLYADGDDEWRIKQNLEMFQLLKEAGNKDLTIQMIENRRHLTIWNRMTVEDEVFKRIRDFVFDHSKTK